MNWIVENWLVILLVILFVVVAGCGGSYYDFDDED